MRKVKHPVFRLVAMLVMVLSMTSMSVLSAAAAPGQSANAPRAQAQTVEVCANLIDIGFLGAEGNLADLYVGVDVNTLLPIVNNLLSLAGLDTLEVDVLAQVLAGGCVVDVPAPGFLTVIVTDEAGAAIPGATVAIDGAESGTVNPDGSFTTAAQYEPGDYPFTASAPGYVTGSGVVTVVDGNASATVVLALAEVPPAEGFLTVILLDEAGAPLAGATVTFDNGESGLTNPDGSFTTAGTYVPGDYPFTATLDGFEPISGTVTVVDGNASTTLTMEAVTVPVPAVIGLQLCLALDVDGDGIITQAEIDAAITAGTLDALVDADVIVSLLAGGCDEFLNPPVEPEPAVIGLELCLAIDVDGDGIITQAEIDAAITAGTLDALVDADVIVSLLAGGCDEFLNPVPTTGTVDVQKFYCESVTSVEFDGAVADDCLTGAATFTFYLVGDGTDDFEQLPVYEDGFGSIDLAAGDYIVVEEGTQAETPITVTAGATTTLVVENPGTTPAPRDGTVNASAFSCSNIDDVEFYSDNGVVLAAALPTEEPACDPTSAIFTFYLIGDGTNDYVQLAVDGAGSIQLAPGIYEVVEENTQARVFIEVLPGDFTTLVINIPTGENVPGTSVNVVKYYCDTVTETEFLVVDGGSTSREELPGAPDCAPGAATFTFYLVGDGTNDFAQLEVSGAGTIGLLPGTYEVVEEGTLATSTITVVDGENTLLVVNNPMPEDGEVPGVPGGDNGADNGDNGTDAGGDNGAKSDAGAVTALPSTGSGQVAESQVWMLMAGAAVLSAVGFQITRRQTNS